MAMKFKKQPSKFIKPSTPTPPNLKHYKIGFLDELAPLADVPIVLFFTKNNNHDATFAVQLEKSLEKTLVQLYPLAGRYVETSQTIECNDEGVEFIQAKVNIKLEDILLQEANVKSVHEFIPFKTKTCNIVLRVQLTTFECGGVALGVSAMHKLVDASTLCTFLNEWAAMNRGESEIKLTRPSFISSSLFPARGLPPMPTPHQTDDTTLSKLTMKKLSFNESAISNMRAKAIMSRKHDACRLSKVQLVSSFIWKALISVDHTTRGYLRESILFQLISLRERMASPIPKHSCGNIWGLCATNPATAETFEKLTNLSNDAVRKVINDFSRVHHDSEQGQTIVLNSILNFINVPETINACLVSSWCKFPFYEADFGLGKPVLVVPAGIMPLKNLALLIDDVGGNGVEAYICLDRG
ncbi:hypothetical protein QVD17_16416 [Tagetes erecta]|uniref:Transferase, Chloramphenicol acetyltransferase-like domain protein n=1 Tax=Tagetes erecta TaxID=13708 RepID=A0AAD8KRK2_TARER|nr:hypothetical protein QVD17_16416 [Tagetes erecta]